MNAFLLNALASAIIIVTAIYLKGRFNKFKDFNGRTVTQAVSVKGILVTFIVTFLASFFGYWLLYYTFGFGGAMISEG